MYRRAVLRLAISAPILAAVLYLGAARVGPLPALGPFLHPGTGVWTATGFDRIEGEATGTVPGLTAPVHITYDDRGVPHIFAVDAEDAARALGYVVARDRLFQLEMRWRAAAGRLSELFGASALSYDRRIRSIGLAWSAERDLARLEPGSAFALQVAAYADGINAWIDGLERRNLPLEYHLLGVEPARWDPVYSLYVIKLMGEDLTYYTAPDLTRLRVAERVGFEAADALFPIHAPIQEPIEPNGAPGPRYDFAELPPPGEPAEAAGRLARVLEPAMSPELEPASIASLMLRGMPVTDRAADPGALGSNNWAVAPGRTAAGHALLAGDPHLELTLPSTWYETHLIVRDALDLYGASTPGVPGVILGFNRDVAWSFTNTGADVIDYYEEELDDPETPTRYRVDGVWRDLEARIEVYRGRHGQTLAVDTLHFTHRGPLIAVDGRALSMRWTVLEGVGAGSALPRAAATSDADAWLLAMKGWDAPAQNMVVADRGGTIAIRSTGHYPVRPDGGSGLRVRDGRQSASDWSGYWPVEEYPLARDPAQGFLASANQQPRDPQVDSRYLGADWPSPWRALRINALLRADSAATPDAMRRYQTDPGNARAEMFLPFFLQVGSTDPEAGTATQGAGRADGARRAARLLAEWDGGYTKENERAILFEYAMDELADRTWDELLPIDSTGEPRTRRVATPGTAILAGLLRDPGSLWWDDTRSAEHVETRDEILRAALAAALERAIDRHGEPDGGGWRWDRLRHANIYHLLRIPALSALDVPVQGGPGNLNPSSGSGRHGASWRMVVELGPELRAWTIYPGGQSGHPLSPRYRDRVGKWSTGELDPVLFPRRPADLDPERVLATLTLTPGD